MAVKETDDDKKVRNYWCLTQEAIDNGKVQSTTRYRKANSKKAVNSELPAPSRQAPGQKGGRAANARNARMRRPLGEQHDARYFPSPSHQQPHPSQLPLQTDHSLFPPSEMAPYPMSSIMPMSNLPADPAYPELGSKSMIGCNSASSTDNRLFCDIPESGPNCAGSDMGQLGWY